jgi:hypothetical protein
LSDVTVIDVVVWAPPPHRVAEERNLCHRRTAGTLLNDIVGYSGWRERGGGLFEGWDGV